MVSPTIFTVIEPRAVKEDETKLRYSIQNEAALKVKDIRKMHANQM
jgi:hypothetical protein